MTDGSHTPVLDDIERLDAIIKAVGRGSERAIPLLQAVQEQWQHLPAWALKAVAERTEMTLAQLYGVASFYGEFRFEPCGRHRVKVCVGTACHVKGAGRVYEAFRRALRLAEGTYTDAHGVFSVEKVACLGCCMLAPAVQVDDVTYGNVDPLSVAELLHDFLEVRKCRQEVESAEASTHAGGGALDVRMCTCTSCEAAGAAEVAARLERAGRTLGVGVTVTRVGCDGASYRAPAVEVVGEGGQRVRYLHVRPGQAESIVRKHAEVRGWRVWRRRAGAMLERLAGYPREAPPRMETEPDGFLTGQRRLVTAGAGEVDALSLEAYRREGGFEAFARSAAMAPERVLEELARAGLRGRGGAGYPTAAKWAAVVASQGPAKYVICNGDEGDPGAFMDRMLLESFTFRVIEGVAIAARTVGAREAVFYVRSEYPLALKRLRHAIRQCSDAGLLGAPEASDAWGVRMRVFQGAGAFVCGEESALIESLQGRRGMPRARPPFPSEKGLWQCPTLVNNVETLACVPWILLHSGDRFAELGSRGSRGTKTIALAGKVRRGGLVEVPMGMTLRQLVDEIGGGVPEGRTLKAVQIGGPSGGCIPAALCETAVDFDALGQLGGMMGSGGVVVLDDSDCMVEIARYFLEFTQRESCGKCTFCRVGTKRMLEILERLCAGKAEAADLGRLEQLGRLSGTAGLCGLGRSAPNPMLSTLRHFRDEYEAHLRGVCPALVCKAMIQYSIGKRCIGCTRCAQGCPVTCIDGEPGERHAIDSARCVRCGACRSVCPAGAVDLLAMPAGEVLHAR